jgi:hypothetical protein
MAYTLSGLFQSIHGLQVVEPATNKFTTAQPQEEHIVALLNTNTNTCTVNMPTTRQRHDGHRYRGTSKAVQRENRCDCRNGHICGVIAQNGQLSCLQ